MSSDIRETASLLPDDDLWHLLTGEPRSPLRQDCREDFVSLRWINWAKGIITDVSYIPGDGQRNGEPFAMDDALVTYLCRLMRVLDCIAENAAPVRKEAKELQNLLLGAADIAGLPDRLKGRVHGVWDWRTLKRACDLGMVQAKEVDLWNFGMASGSGLTTLYGLTLLGRRKAEAGNPPPPFRWNEQDDADLAAAEQATEDSEQAEQATETMPEATSAASARASDSTTDSTADTDTTPVDTKKPEVPSVVSAGEPDLGASPDWVRRPPCIGPSSPVPLAAQATSNVGLVTVHNQIHIDAGAVADLVVQKMTPSLAVPKLSPPPVAAKEGSNAGSAKPKHLPERAATALKQWQQAVTRLREEGNDSPTDFQCHECFKESNDGEKLPEFETWQRYLRQARNYANDQKNTPRAGREHGRSMVRPDDVAPEEADCLTGLVRRQSNGK